MPMLAILCYADTKITACPAVVLFFSGLSPAGVNAVSGQPADHAGAGVGVIKKQKRT